MKTFKNFTTELAEAWNYTKKAKWFALGDKVNMAMDAKLKPQKSDYNIAAKKLGISVADAEKAWHVYTWDSEVPQKNAPEVK